MAQRSLPQAGTGVGDSGPYSSDEWAEYFQTVFTGDQQATQGPIRHFLNELEVTEAALAVTTATGAGFVYGHFLINDVLLNINILLAAAGQERYDRVVMVENNTNAVYNTNLALPADYAAGVPRNSARVAILQGAEAGAAVLPALLTGPNYYMVELARYLVDDATVGSVEDRRDFCGLGASGPETQYLWVPAELGFDVTDSLDIPLTTETECSIAIMLPDDHWCWAYGRFTVPGNYLSTMAARGVVVFDWPSGNIRARNIAQTGAIGFAPATTVDSTGDVTEAVVHSRYASVASLNISPLEQGDIVTLWFTRHGENAADTLGDVAFPGWLVSYTTLT